MMCYGVFTKNEFVTSFDDRHEAYECAKEYTNKYGREYNVREHFVSNFRPTPKRVRLITSYGITESK